MEFRFEEDDNNEERCSFDDSDRFEEDSLCSWVSEPESVCGNWRGWKRNSQKGDQHFDSGIEENVDSLIEICARTVAKHIPFETVENTYPQIPEQLQVRIAFWSFPPVEDDIRLYSCLANGSPDKFTEGEQLLRNKSVKDVLQMGFHLSATVHQPHSLCQSKGTFNVAVTFDRGHITSCNCTCDQSATWCSHVIALCLFRIHYPNLVCLRAPVSEYLSRLKRNQLQKFAQYLITELPQQLLPTAQRLLDELLSSQESIINSLSGAPDPTAGPSAVDQSKWCLDEESLHENIKKMLIRFCGPSPLVFSDVNALYLANTAPPTAAEWSNLLRPLQGREPEGMWNLLSIVRELFHRGDMNAVNLLVILTEECLANDMVLIWWFDSRSQASGNSLSHSHGNNYRGNTNAASTEATKHACAGFCDELVTLWRLAVLNPKLTDEERQEIKLQLEMWHKKAVEKGRAGRGSSFIGASAEMSCFPGFLPAIEACSLNWKNIDLDVPLDVEYSLMIPSTLPRARSFVPDSTRTDHCETSDLSQALVLSLEVESETEKEGNRSSCALQESHTAALVSLQEIDEDLEVLCARTEALNVHGYSSVAAKLAVRLAESILSDTAKQASSMNATSGAKNKSRDPPGTTLFTSTVVVRAAFLCNVLTDNPHCHHLAFRVGMLGLEMPRQPAKSKALEVKLANQETELVNLLKKLPLGPAELAVVREKAELLRQGQLRRGEAVLPIMLATFIFDILCSSDRLRHASRAVAGKLCDTSKEDEELGFQAAIYALGMKGSALETQYPMLCEGIRQQRGDLALALLLHSRDDSSRVRQVMDVLLDKSRYDIPSSNVGNQSKQKPSSEERNGGNNHSGASGEVNGREVLACEVTERKGSVPSLSSTSDSGTDSSKDSSVTERDRSRVKSGRPPASRLTVTVSEVSIDDESGSSSGVDTDLAPMSRSADGSHITVKVVQVTPGHLRGLTEAPRVLNSAVNTPHDTPDCRPVSEPSTGDIILTVPNGGAMPHSSLHNVGTTGDICLAGVPQIDDPAGLAQNEVHLNDGISLACDQEERGADSRDHIVGGCALDEGTSDEGSLGLSYRSRGTSGMVAAGELASHTGSNALGDPVVEQIGMTNLRRFSSEGDVSDIEADFEEVHREAIEQAAINAKSSAASVRATFCSSTTPALNKAVPGTSESCLDDDHSAQYASSVEAQSDDAIPASAPDGTGNVDGDVTSAVAAEQSVEEAIDEQSSGSGARGSASPSADNADRNRRRPRHRGRRRRRGGKSAVYQATEAEAHFMFELAKTVLNKAGGSSSTSVFCTQPASSETPSGPHKVLLLCAFEMGLFALGLHNRTSPNWLSRTYSSHVSWITERAMDIGHQAIALLLERWEGNLTPSEVASIADRASNSNDRAMVRAAAELGLSCLHMAHTLNPVEIKRALSQCREEDSQLLDQACQAVETAARGGGVYPEVLFDVARQWYHLHEQSQTNSGTSRSSAKTESRARNSQSRSSQVSSSNHSPPLSPFAPQVPQFNFPPGFSCMPSPLYATPEEYVQQQMHQHVHQLLRHYPSYRSGSSTGYRCGSQPNFSYPRSLTGTQFSLSGAYAGLPPPPYQNNSGSANSSQHVSRVSTTQQGTHVSYYLNSAYRVGMLALEFLSRRTSDDRPNVKFSRNPASSDDIRWLCNLSAKALGMSHLQRFCVAALNAVVSPFLLHDLALESARHMAKSNPAQLAANLRSPTISPLVQKSLTMYAQCIHYHLINITQSEYDEFVELLRHARGAFCMAPGGMTQFNELLQSIRWGYAKKKELWQMIMTGLAKA